MSVKVGRKELFSFAERHSSKSRLKEYSCLSDGHVACDLFSLVFPQHRIRPASEDTLSHTQRARVNWELLFRNFAKLYIPLELLDPPALAANNTEKGFSTLVLFYFLYNLSKKTDFSAEFSMDVTETLTQFLQSIDSIGALVLGGALSLRSVPDHLVEALQSLPGFQASEEDRKRREEEAVHVFRNVMNITVKKRAPSKGITVVQAARESSTDTRTSPSGSRCTSTESGVVPSRTSSRDQSHRPPSVKKEEPPRQAALAQEVASLRAELESVQRESAKREEALLKKYHDEVLHSKLLAENIAETARENEILKRNQRQSTTSDAGAREIPEDEVEALLADVTDPETHEGIDAHTTANLLHSILLEHLGHAPILRKQAQAWLWSILSAYHVLETRLVSAVEMIDALRDERGCRPVPVQPPAQPSTDVEEGRIQRAVIAERSKWETKLLHLKECQDSQLETLHHTEHQLRQSLLDRHHRYDALSSQAKQREKSWRALCGALHQAEQAVFAVLECDDEQEAEERWKEREQCYETIDRITNELLEDNKRSLNTSVIPSEVESEKLCTSLKMRLDNAIQERNEYLSTIATLREEMKQLLDRSLSTEAPIGKGNNNNNNREKTVFPTYYKKLTPSEASDLPPPKTPEAKPFPPESSPYGKKLTTLLDEASSPYDRYGYT